MAEPIQVFLRSSRLDHKPLHVALCDHLGSLGEIIRACDPVRYGESNCCSAQASSFFNEKGLLHTATDSIEGQERNNIISIALCDSE
jgi:hypothetical protein